MQLFRKLRDRYMIKFKVNQKLLFKAATVYHLRPLDKYKVLFSFLDTSPLETLYPATSKLSVLYVSYISDLARNLWNYPDLTLVFGFHSL